MLNDHRHENWLCNRHSCRVWKTSLVSCSTRYKRYTCIKDLSVLYSVEEFRLPNANVPHLPVPSTEDVVGSNTLIQLVILYNLKPVTLRGCKHQSHRKASKLSKSSNALITVREKYCIRMQLKQKQQLKKYLVLLLPSGVMIRSFLTL